MPAMPIGTLACPDTSRQPRVLNLAAATPTRSDMGTAGRGR